MKTAMRNAGRMKMKKKKDEWRKAGNKNDAEK